jgi:hypothetical protein
MHLDRRGTLLYYRDVRFITYFLPKNKNPFSARGVFIMPFQFLKNRRFFTILILIIKTSLDESQGM